MKTYFLAWEADNRRGHAIYDFDEDVTPRQALAEMINCAVKECSESDIPIRGTITATQFNRVA